MGLLEHADYELKLAGFDQKDSDYDGELYKAVMELMQVFVEQGHSGFSAVRTIQLFSKLANYENLTPLTFNDDEWNECGLNPYKDKMTYQNKRVFSVFKDGKDGDPHFTSAIVWREENGVCFTGCIEGISSAQYIDTSKPFAPKRFYVDVIKENGKEDCEFVIKDRTQLDEVFKYYVKKEVK